MTVWRSGNGVGRIDENFVKFGRVVFDMCEYGQTDRQADKQTR